MISIHGFFFLINYCSFGHILSPKRICPWMNPNQLSQILVAVMSLEHRGILYHWKLNCMFNSLFRQTRKQKPKLHINDTLKGEYVCHHHQGTEMQQASRDDVMKWKHFPNYWPFVRVIHRWPVNSHHKGQWHGALMVVLICTWTNGWPNHRDASDLRHICNHYDITVILMSRHDLHYSHQLISL